MSLTANALGRLLRRPVGCRLLLGLVAALLLAPTLAHADAKDDARRAFQRGMSLISEGEQLAGIESLQRAYEILPHASVLYNIALAYVDAGLHRSAIEYFDRYLESAPADDAAVRSLISVLQGQLVAPEKQEEVNSDAPVESSETPETADPRIEELIARLEGLAERIEGSVDPPGGDSDVPVKSPDLVSKTEGVYEEVVVSASRQATNSLNAPAPTTIITAEEIRLSGATTIYDVLRRVPGLSILTSGSGHADLAIRGFNQRVSNKILVLVDGRSVYL
ncbi:MAG: TonB-dependent receptor plug domain-containing protein, partial [Myxococcota bacterium]|nr:TonB-dependent receptor plug domain-containing protein [Myxococcota bacterium]